MEIGIYRDKISEEYIAKPILKKTFIPVRIKYLFKYEPKFYSRGEVSKSRIGLGIGLGNALRLNNIKSCNICRVFCEGGAIISLDDLEEIVEEINPSFHENNPIDFEIKKEVRGIVR